MQPERTMSPPLRSASPDIQPEAGDEGSPRVDDGPDAANLVDGGGVGVGGGDEETLSTSDFDTVVSGHVSNLSEDRGSTRQSSFAALVRCFARRFSYDEAAANVETIIEMSKRAVKRGSVAEGRLALRLCCIVCLTLEETGGGAVVYDELMPFLSPLLTTCKKQELRCEIVYSFAVLTFLAGQDDAASLNAMEALFEIVRREHKKLESATGSAVSGGANSRSTSGGLSAAARAAAAPVQTALAGWSALASTLAPGLLAGPLFRDCCAPLVTLLDHGSVDIRMGSVECLAILIEAHQAAQHEDDYDRVGGSPDDEEGNGSGAGTSGFQEDAEGRILVGPDGEPLAVPAALVKLALDVDSGHLLSKLSQLARDRTRGRAKKDRSKQRQIFREVEALLEDGSAPSETVTIAKQRFTFTGFASVARLNFTRNLLGSGFQEHFMYNSLVHAVLQVDVDPQGASGGQMSRIEKRLGMSPNSASARNRDRSINKKRDIKRSAQFNEQLIAD